LTVRDKYLGYVKYFVSAPNKTAKVLGGMVLFILFMFMITPKGFLPTEDKGALFTQIQLPDGASVSRSDVVGSYVSKKISEIPGVMSTLEIAGFSGDNSVFICIKKNIRNSWCNEYIRDCRFFRR